MRDINKFGYCYRFVMLDKFDNWEIKSFSINLHYNKYFIPLLRSCVSIVRGVALQFLDNIESLFFRYVQLQQLSHSSAAPSLTAVKTPQKTRFWQLDLVLLLQHTKAVSIKVCHNAQPRRLTYLIAVFNISICLVATHTVQHETGTRERRLRKKSTQTGERLAKRWCVSDALWEWDWDWKCARRWRWGWGRGRGWGGGQCVTRGLGWAGSLGCWIKQLKTTTAYGLNAADFWAYRLTNDTSDTADNNNNNNTRSICASIIATRWATIRATRGAGWVGEGFLLSCNLWQYMQR